MEFKQKEDSQPPFEESDESEGIKRPFSRCRPKKKLTTLYELMKEPDEGYVPKLDHKIDGKLSFYVERENNQSSSESYQESSQEVDAPKKGDEKNEDIMSFVGSEFEEIQDVLDGYQDGKGRQIWHIMNPEGTTRYFTEKAILANELSRQQFYTILPQAKQESPVQKRESKALEKSARRMRRAIKDEDEQPKQRAKPQKDKNRQAANISNYMKQAFETQIRKHGQRGTDQAFIHDVAEAEAKEKDKTELKPDSVDVSVFNEAGTLDKHIPLEIIDFIGQPPFRGDTSQLKVLVRWKYFDKQNYQPLQSEVYYHQLRDKYPRLLIDLFVRKTQLKRKYDR